MNRLCRSCHVPDTLPNPVSALPSIASAVRLDVGLSFKTHPETPDLSGGVPQNILDSLTNPHSPDLEFDVSDKKLYRVGRKAAVLPLSCAPSH